MLLVILGLVGVLLIIPAIMLVVLVLAKRHTPKKTGSRRDSRPRNNRKRR